MTTPTSSSNCPQCGTPATQGIAGDLCPACLLKQVALGTGADSNLSEPWTPPAISELTTAFPQLEIIELIGRGGMGAVYKARQKSLGRVVAVKILAPQHAANPAFAERFSREAQALAELNHPNIVTVHDFGLAGQFYFLLMEYVDGVNLRQAMKAGHLTPEQVLIIVPSICEALQFAHDRGIVHRDIKPENLLLDKAGGVKIADFGIARIMGAAFDLPVGAAELDSDGLTQESVLGTPPYMAPEQSAYPTQVDHRADIYSIGVVFYELLTGELPLGNFERPSKRVLIDVRLDSIVLRALEQSPKLRYQSIGEMRVQVQTVVDESDHTKSENHAYSATSRQASVTCYISTLEQLATVDGQFSLWRRKAQLLLNDRALTFTRVGTTTVIPLSAIRDFSIGHYPRIMNPGGLDFINVTYEAAGGTIRLLFSPCESIFGFPSQFNRFVAEWFDVIRAKITKATGQAPANTPANQLGTPPSSPVLLFGFLLMLLFPLLLLFVTHSWRPARIPLNPYDVESIAPATESIPTRDRPLYEPLKRPKSDSKPKP
jgi:serine/threonine protein kinase